MASAGHNLGPGEPVPYQAQGAAYGFPEHQIKGEGGEAHVKVNKDVAERFEAAKQHAHESSAGKDIAANIPDTHKTGMETVTDRARNLTEVTEAKVQSGGQAETRTPDIGMPGK